MNKNPIMYSSPKKKASLPSLSDINSGFHIIFLYKDLVRLLHKASIFMVKSLYIKNRYKLNVCCEMGAYSSMTL